jgi:hypothetical protein
VNAKVAPRRATTELFCRVEGRGTATIHDVALSSVPSPPIETTSATIEELVSKKQRTGKALERCKKSLNSLEVYLSTLNVQHIDPTALGEVIDNYEATGAILDEKALDLEKTLNGIDEQLENERKKLAGPRRDDRLHQRATIGVFAKVEGEVQMALIYGMWNDGMRNTVFKSQKTAVYQANWTAGYDIRVDMQTKDKPIMLMYKAAITQNTGEVCSSNSR